MTTPSEEEARAAAEAHFPHGDVRPYATRHFIAGYLAALASRVSTPPSEPLRCTHGMEFGDCAVLGCPGPSEPKEEQNNAD